MTEENTNTEQAEVETETAPVVDEKAEWRSKLSVEGKARKAAESRLAEYEARDREKAEADQLANNEHLEVINSLKQQLVEKETATAAAEKSARMSKLDSALVGHGAARELERIGLAAKYDGDSDPAEFAAKMLIDYPDAFVPVQTPARSAGSHGSVSTSPTTTGHEEILKLWNSKDNRDIATAVKMAETLNNSGQLPKELADKLGFE